MSKDAPPVVAPRNDPKPQPVFVKATIADQAGYRKGYVRQWFSTDKDDPRYWGKYTKAHHVGDPGTGYAKAEAWTHVDEADAAPGRKRDDDGKGIDGKLTHGDLVCLETPEDNYAVYREWDRLKDEREAKRLKNDRKDKETVRGEDGRPVAGFGGRVVTSNEGFANHQDLLRQGS